MGHPSLSIGEDVTLSSTQLFRSQHTPEFWPSYPRRAPHTKMSAMAGSSRGDFETQQLRANVEEQLQRLLTQLEDLDELRDEMDDGEYEETRAETMQQLEEFEQSLEKMKEGNMTLVSELNSVQLAIQTTIRNAFKTPEVIKMFAKREPEALRKRLATLEGERRLNRLPEDVFQTQCVEILLALKKLGEKLSPQEEHLLQKATRNMDHLVESSTAIGDTVEKDMMNRAGTHVAAAAAKHGR